MLAERPRPERLRGVVLGGEEADPTLAGDRAPPFGRIAGDERVEPLGDGVVDVACAASGDNSDAPNQLGAVRQGERLA